VQTWGIWRGNEEGWRREEKEMRKGRSRRRKLMLKMRRKEVKGTVLRGCEK
jgi:hypothetical protein